MIADPTERSIDCLFTDAVNVRVEVYCITTQLIDHCLIALARVCTITPLLTLRG